jgi:hypothetical protein
MRALYRCLLWLHPPAFRRQFAEEMLWIFDESGESGPLLLDGLVSLARQWLLRSGWWKTAAAVVLAMLQVGVMVLSPHRFVRIPAGHPQMDVSEILNRGPMAQQPITVGILMYLAVFVVGGLVLLTIGLTYWMKHLALRRLR